MKKPYLWELNKVNEFIFTKHNIVPGTQLDSIEDVVRNHLGLHSARIGTPYVTLCSRLRQYKPNMLTSKLYKERTLIKMRCVRTTLHITSKDIAPILFKATLDMRLSECILFFKRNNIPLNNIDHLKNKINSKFNRNPLLASEIEKWIISEIKDEIPPKIQKEYAKKVLKYIWEKGVLSYYNAASSWENEDRRYVLTSSFYPDIKFEKYRPDEAKELLIIEYIKKFGPVTIKDIAWWSGLSLILIKSTIINNASKVCKIKVESFNNYFYVSLEDFHNFNSFKKINFDWVSLLAFEDPSLKGYFESRSSIC